MCIFRFVPTTLSRISNICTIQTRTRSSIICSKVANIQMAHQSIPEYVWNGLDKWHNKTAVICFKSGRNYTFGQIYENSCSLAAQLQNSFRLNKGTTVAIILPNIPEFPIVFLGALQAGLVVTAINPLYTADETIFQLKDARPRAIFTTGDLKASVTEAAKVLGYQLPIIVCDKDCSSLSLSTLCLESSSSNSVDLNPEDVALLPYSSGTTGLPKGVELTHTNVVSNLQQMSSPEFIVNSRTQSDCQDVIPVILPLFHIYGMVCIFLNYFSKGCKLVTVPEFIPAQMQRMLQTYRPTLMFAVPQIISLLLNNSKIKSEDLSSIETIISSAAPLGLTMVKKLSEKTDGKVNLLQMYGMTETSPLTLMQSRFLDNGLKIGGSGFLLPNTECMVLSNDGLEHLGPSKSGELLMRGPQIMRGYHNNPLATKEILLEDGWLRTGDVGHYDDHGHFFVTDRLKEIIKVKGFQVAPAELEAVLRDHPEIQDAGVIGVPHPTQGEVPKAFVVLRKQSRMRPEHIKEYVATRVAGYKRLLGGVVILDTIPRNVAGKYFADN